MIGLKPFDVLAVLGCGEGVIGLRFVGLVTDRFEMLSERVDVGVCAWPWPWLLCGF